MPNNNNRVLVKIHQLKGNAGGERKNGGVNNHQLGKGQKRKTLRSLSQKNLIKLKEDGFQVFTGIFQIDLLMRISWNRSILLMGMCRVSVGRRDGRRKRGGLIRTKIL